MGAPGWRQVIKGMSQQLINPEKRKTNPETLDSAMDVRSNDFESVKSYFFDTSTWGPFCSVTLTLRQGRQPDNGGWVRIDQYQCRRAFRHFINLLNRAVYGAAFRRHRKRLRVLPVLEKGEVRARALRSVERGASGRWHIHFAIESPAHFDDVALEHLIRECWKGRVGVWANLCPRPCECGLGRLHVERDTKVSVREIS